MQHPSPSHWQDAPRTRRQRVNTGVPFRPHCTCLAMPRCHLCPCISSCPSFHIGTGYITSCPLVAQRMLPACEPVLDLIFFSDVKARHIAKAAPASARSTPHTVLPPLPPSPCPNQRRNHRIVHLSIQSTIQALPTASTPHWNFATFLPRDPSALSLLAHQPGPTSPADLPGPPARRCLPQL